MILCVCLCVWGVAGCRPLEREVPLRKVSQKKKRTPECRVAERRLLCKVSDDCQAVWKTRLDREVRGRLITILRGKGEMLYIALCGLRSWVSCTEVLEVRVLQDGRVKLHGPNPSSSCRIDHPRQELQCEERHTFQSDCYNMNAQTGKRTCLIRHLFPNLIQKKL